MWLSTDRARRLMRQHGLAQSETTQRLGPWDQHLAADSLNTYVHSVTSAEFKRWRERQGASFEPAKGGHIWVLLRGRRAILPMHGSRKEMKRGTVEAIKKQLGLE